MHAQGNRASGTSWRQVGGMAAVFLVALVTLSGVAFPQGEIPEAPAPGAALSTILDKLHGALDALDDRVDGVGWTGLADQLKEIRAVLEGLIRDVATPPTAGAEAPSLKQEVVTLDLLLHRLLDTLERLAEQTGPADAASLARERAKEAMAELRTYLEGYLRGVSSSLDRGQLALLERVARALLEEIGQRVARQSPSTQPGNPQEPRLDLLTKEISGLLERLDRFILHASVLPRAEGPATAP